jgi:hypothetical protein
MAITQRPIMANSGWPIPIKTAAEKMISSAIAGINFEGMRANLSNGQRVQPNRIQIPQQTR